MLLEVLEALARRAPREALVAQALLAQPVLHLRLLALPDLRVILGRRDPRVCKAVLVQLDLKEILGRLARREVKELPGLQDRQEILGRQALRGQQEAVVLQEDQLLKFSITMQDLLLVLLDW